MLRRLPALLALLLPLSAAAQSQFGFEYRPEAAAVQAGGNPLPLAWTGGLNSPQYSQLDLNGDGQNDLVVFERVNSRLLTFLSVAAPGGGRRWQYAPDYESLFPQDLNNWVLLRDYDCDGRPDLWTQAGPGDIRVFRNVAGPGGRPRFQLASGLLMFANTPTFSGNIHLSGYDIPAIQDVDGDGKLDILGFDYGASTQVQYYRNVSASCGGLSYRYESLTWAGLTFCGATCTDYATGGNACAPVRSTASGPGAKPNATNHTGGYSLLLQDFDQDGDQDLLLGRDSCPELVAIRNTGTNATAATNAGSVLTTLPGGIGSVSLPNFPAAYAIDANQDGKQDLVVASGLVNNSDMTSMRRNGLLFENTSATAVPAYTRNAAPFLQDQMVDVSEAAATAFADLDGDGLVDMLVANAADQYGAPLSDGTYRATLAHYRNTGTAARPVFSLVTTDYLGLSARNFRNLRPVFTDLNRDGAVDLAFSGYYIGASFVFYYLNTAAAGRPVSFDTAQLNNLNGVGNLAKTTPCFADVDADGYLDLLVGIGANPSGLNSPLSYYRRNPAQPLNDAFTLVNNDFGRIRTANNEKPSYLAPAVADVDRDGTPDLMAIDHTGTLHLFANYRSQSGVFLDRTDLLLNSVSGQYAVSRLGDNIEARNHLALADITGDGTPELVVGTEAGGLLLYGARNVVTTARSKAAEALPLQVFPNPAQEQVTIETPTATRVLLRDLLGRPVRHSEAPLRRHQLNVQGLAAGVYLLEATDAAGRRGVQRLTVK
ncbi:hypothetical protein GCM10027048_36130 [Hymenobacter coalescens]